MNKKLDKNLKGVANILKKQQIPTKNRKLLNLDVEQMQRDAVGEYLGMNIQADTPIKRIIYAMVSKMKEIEKK